MGIIVLAGTLVAEHMLLLGQVTNQQMQKLARIDRVYGISAVVVLLAGLSLWFWVGKPQEFYSKNGIFHAKITLFVIMGLLSIYPTLFINKASRSEENFITIPKRVINIVRAELACLVLIPLMAVFMARGYGL
jgi:putative membrane protein